MLIELNRIFTATDLREKYQIPASLFTTLLPLIPWVHEHDNVRYYLESKVDKFLNDWLLEYSVPHGQGGGSSDGLIQLDRFRLHGKEYTGIKGFQRRLLEALWQRGPTPIEAIKDHVYGHDEERSDDALRSLARRLNDVLAKQSCPAEVQPGGEFYPTFRDRL